MITNHIRRMLAVSQALAEWCQRPGVTAEQGLAKFVDIAEQVGPERTAEFAAALARHAAAELEMERLQTRDGWPEA